MTTGARPLLITADDELREGLVRLAAATGAAVEVEPSPAALARAWQSAPLVLVGADLLAEVAAQQPGRRQDVHVLTTGSLPEHLFRVALAVGAEGVLELPAAETWLVERLADVAESPDGAGAGAGAVCVGVVAGAGGAGASTLAAALALTAAARCGPTTLVDADPLGGGLERLTGAESAGGGPPGGGWDTLAGSAGRLSARALRGSLPARAGLAVLGWGRTPCAAPVAPSPDLAREVLAAARRGGVLVVVDLPRHPDPAATELVRSCDHLLVVTRLDVPAVAATGRLLGRLGGAAPEPRLVARGPAGALDPRAVARALGVRLLVDMADQRGLDEAVDLGLGPVSRGRGPLARAATEVLAALRVPGEGGP